MTSPGEIAMLTQQRLCEILDYDPVTGDFTWLVSRGRCAKTGSLAGNIHTEQDGRQYRRIKIDGLTYRAHRLVWLFVHGVWPVEHVDHIDGDGLNNRIGNLREATASQNAHNKGAQINNSSGYKGVHWQKQSGKWHARICLNGRRQHLGLFDTPEAAHAAYCGAAMKLHGKFARVA